MTLTIDLMIVTTIILPQRFTLSVCLSVSPQAVRQVTWHGKGDYLACVMPDDGSSLQVLIHQVSKRRTQNPFRKNKGMVQCVSFHPIRPYFFVATQRYVRIYNLIKQELTKKLMTNCKWISSIAVHPGGECGPAWAWVLSQDSSQSCSQTDL